MRLGQTMSMGLVLSLVLTLGGCASSGGSRDGAAMSEPTAAPAMASVPAGSPLAAITSGMSETEVHSKLGPPSNRRIYPTGKNWIPFYFGGGTMRTDWIYTGIGRVIFTNTSKFGPNIEVVDVVHNPSE
jgi:hypothetical protein